MTGLGHNAVSVAGPIGVSLLDIFNSCMQLYVLLSPYLCLTSFLYLDFYVLGNDKSTNYGSFVRTKDLSISIRQTLLSPPVIFLLTVPRRCSFCRSFWLFVFRVMQSCLFLADLLPPAGKGPTS